VIGDDELLRLADERAFARGRAYRAGRRIALISLMDEAGL
jgi:hypothetical protein